jgi:hypothetical protein
MEGSLFHKCVVGHVRMLRALAARRVLSFGSYHTQCLSDICLTEKSAVGLDPWSLSLSTFSFECLSVKRIHNCQSYWKRRR